MTKIAWGIENVQERSSYALYVKAIYLWNQGEYAGMR
jgi:hypothetical protein